MIAEEYNNIQSPDLSLEKGKTINFIIDLLKKVPESFVLKISTTSFAKDLSENAFTQILVEQLNALIQEKNINFIGVNAQYIDLYYGATGKPDFYFYATEQDKNIPALFVVESKRLPAPSKDREKEYVIGKKKNGGIERFKREIHGKGFSEAGLIGFVEQNTFEYWHTTINQWIQNLADESDFWNIDEKLELIETQQYLNHLKSIAHRSNDDIKLYHFWIRINNPR